jgi:hypothetical protein
MNREIEIADTPDGTKCYVWVHTEELADLRQHGSTTTQLRQIITDHPHEEINTALEHITGWSAEDLEQHPDGWRRYALRWP